MNLILDILYIYVAIYSLIFLVMALKNLGSKKFLLQKRHSQMAYKNKLCVMIYSHDDEENLIKIVQQLKSQAYSLDNFMIYIVLDNCSDNSEQAFAYDSMVQIFSIKDQGTVGKDQAFSILLEKLSEQKICDAYVFLDAKRYVDKDFLENINAGLVDSPVFSGSTILLGENLNIRQKIKMAYHKYYTNFLQRSRAMLGLAMNIDSDIFVIRHELLTKIGSINFKDINSELKYSLLLSKLGYKCVFNPNVKTYINENTFRLRIPSLSARLDLFRECFGQTFVGANFGFAEHVYSLLSPNIILLLIIYEFILEYSFDYYFMVDFSVVLISFCVLVLGFALSLINSKLKGKEYLYLFLYPIYSITHIFKNFPVIRFVRNKVSGKTPAEVEKFSVNVFVSNGKKVIPCTMELISESGLAKVKLIFKNKKLVTKTQLRMVDATSEIINKLSDYGMTLKICQCCANFTQSIDGTKNMVKGYCNQDFVVSQGGQIETLLWNSCKGFTPIQQQSLIEEISNE